MTGAASTSFKECSFLAQGGFQCDLSFPTRKAIPGTAQWELVLRTYLCQLCAAECRRRHKETPECPQ